jgi:hypothetical protein
MTKRQGAKIRFMCLWDRHFRLFHAKGSPRLKDSPFLDASWNLTWSPEEDDRGAHTRQLKKIRMPRIRSEGNREVVEAFIESGASR